jgi:hypothetical protein
MASPLSGGDRQESRRVAWLHGTLGDSLRGEGEVVAGELKIGRVDHVRG